MAAIFNWFLRLFRRDDYKEHRKNTGKTKYQVKGKRKKRKKK